VVRTPAPPGNESEVRDSHDRRRLVIGLLIVAVAVTSGSLGWLFRGSIDQFSPTAAPLGLATDFPPGSVTERVLDIGYFDPVGVENASPEVAPGRAVSTTRLFVVNDPGAGLLALVERSPWLGCRVVEVTRAQAIEFGHRVPAGFERGFLDPCHGGLFSLDGQHLAGPGQRGLDRFPLRYLPDGTVAADLTELQTTSGAAG
jgi:Rieske Fe-S protein